MPDALLLEAGDRLLLEDGFGVLLEDPIVDDPATFSLLLESGDHFLKEDGFGLLLESQPGDPGAPTIGTATASTDGSGQLVIAFTPPSDPGSSAVLDYTAVATPGGLTATATGSPITITGATLDTAYTVVVRARNSTASSADSAASNSVTPTDDFEYYPPSGTTTLAIQAKVGYNDDPNCVSYAFNKTATRKIGSYTYQACAFRDVNRKLVIGKRLLPSGAWTLYQYDGIDQADFGTFDFDSHNVAGVEIDASGYLHVTYDHHVDPLNYRRSTAPIATWTGGMTARLSMLGANESNVTYSAFFREPVTDTLHFMFRDGTSGGGDWYHYIWNDSTRAWSAAPGTATGGRLIYGNTGTIANPYLNGLPKFSSDWDGAGAGWMHINWMWRSNFAGLAYNSDILHAKWNGSAWFTYAGAAQTVPITIANADVVHAIGPGVDLFNQVDFDLDANDRPIVGLIHLVAGSAQLHALHHNGTAWVKEVVTSYVGSASLEFGRPCVVVDRDTNVCTMIGTHLDRSVNEILKWTSAAGDFSSWTESTFATKTGVERYEPRYDARLWQRRKLLQMFVSDVPVTLADGDIVELVQRLTPAAPMPPTIGTATATGATTATVAYTAPDDDGDATITSYVATATPGGQTGALATATSGTITVSGLSPSTTYTFAVQAVNSAGSSGPSWASNSITTEAGGGDPDPEPEPVSQGSRRLTLLEWLRGVT